MKFKLPISNKRFFLIDYVGIITIIRFESAYIMSYIEILVQISTRTIDCNVESTILFNN